MYICCMDHVEIFKALSNKTRLLILQWLKDPEKHFPDQFNSDHTNGMDYVGVCVGQIQQKTGLTQSTVSEYLAVLQRTGLVESTRVGQWTYYKRNEEAFKELKQLIDTAL